MKTSYLKHSISVNNKTSNGIIKIRLGGSCAKTNGHEDFAITGSFWEVGKRRTERNETVSGCAHDEILKAMPELKIFVDLHLCDFNGVPTHAVSNMIFHISQEMPKEKFCNYYRITSEQYEGIKDIKNKVYFTLELEKLGVLKQWKDEANQAIKILEEYTNNEFESEAIKSHLETFDTKEVEDVKKKVKEGYFSKENILKREQKRIKDLKKSMIKKVNDDFNEKVKKYQKEKDICLELIRQGFEISPKTGNIKGAIYYSHTNELNFNWSIEKIKESTILSFIEEIDKKKFSGLKISNNKELIATI